MASRSYASISVESERNKRSGSNGKRSFDGGSTVLKNASLCCGWFFEILSSLPSVSTDVYFQDLVEGILSIGAEWEHLDEHVSSLVFHIKGSVKVDSGTLSFSTIWFLTFGGETVVASCWGTITTLGFGVGPGIDNRACFQWIHRQTFISLSTEKTGEKVWLSNSIVECLGRSTQFCVGIIVCLLECETINNCFSCNINSGGSAVCGFFKRSFDQISLCASSTGRME